MTDLDGRRIGQLVASEFDAFDDGPRGRLDVVDADRDAEPSEEGTFAYAVRDAATGERLARAVLYPDALRLELAPDGEPATVAREQGLRVWSASEHLVVAVESGAHAKRVVPVLLAALDDDNA